MLRSINTYLIILIIIVMLCGCSFNNNGKMPTTTKSGKALDFYKKGCELFDNLRVDDSRVFFEKAVSEDPEFAMAYLRLANTQNNPSDFFAILDKASEYSANVSRSEQLWILGVEAGANGLVDKQGEYFEELVRLYPNDETARMQLGNYYYNIQMYDKALEQYKKILSINEDYPPVYNMLGYTYRLYKNYTESENSFKKYIKLIPNDPNPYDSYAELLLKMGRFDESIENYRKSLKINPYFVASHIGIATALNYKGQHIEARNGLYEFMNIAKTEAQKRQCLLAMAVSHVDEGNTPLAMKVLNKAVELSKANNDLVNMSQDLNLIGFLYLESNQLDKADEYYNMGLEKLEQAEVNELSKRGGRRGRIYTKSRVAVEKNNIEEAKKLADEFFEQVTKANNPAQLRLAHQLYGIIALSENDYQKALIELRQSDQQNTYNLYRIAQAYEGLGDSQTASGFYEKVVNFNALNSLNHSLIRHRAKDKITELSA